MKKLFILCFAFLVSCSGVRAQDMNSSKWQARGRVWADIQENNLQKSQTDHNQNNDALHLNFVGIQDQEVQFYYTTPDEELEEIKRDDKNLRESFEEFMLINFPTYEDIVIAEYDIRLLLYNPTHTDSASVFFPLKDLRRIAQHTKRLVLADDAFMQWYMREYAKELPSLTNDIFTDNEKFLKTEAYYEDGVSTIIFTINDQDNFLQANPEQIELLRQSIILLLKQILHDDGSPEVFGDTVVTSELFYQYMKAYRYLYIGEKSQKGIELYFPIEEILKAPDIPLDDQETSDEYLLRIYQIQRYQKMVKDFSRECPIKEGVLTYTDVSFHDNSLHVYVTLDTSAAEIMNMVSLKKAISLLMSSNNDAVLYKELVPMDAGLVFHYQISDTVTDILYTPEEIKDVFSDMDDEAVIRMRKDASLHMLIQNTNLNCPVVLEDFGTIDSIAFSDRSIIYYYTVNDAIKELFFMQGKENVQEVYRMQYIMGDEYTDALLQLCVDAGYGICHRHVEKEMTYTGKKAKKRHRSPRMIKVCFTVDELKGFLKSN